VKVEEVQGQAETQPAIQPVNVEDAALNVARGILEEIDPGSQKPRDEKGKFTKAAPEAPVEPVSEEAAPEEKQEEPAEEEQTEAEVQAEIRKHKLRVKAEDGADVEVEVDDEELKKGYMLERAFRMKTAQIARERESLQTKIKEAVEPKIKEYEEKLNLAEQAIWHTLAPEIQSIDWNKLAAENPAEWAVKYQHVQNVNAKLAQIQQEKQRLVKAREDETRVKLQKQGQESVERLKEEIPGWNNDLYGKILKSGVDMYGFKSDEVNAITDHRAIKVLHDAMQYQALKAKPIVEKRTAPPAPKLIKAGSGEKDASADQWKQGMAKLSKSGRTEDAVELAKLYLAREQKQK
jgi:hypothetical protein